jgi:hypothetical protein
MGNFIKLDTPRKRRLFARRKKQNGIPNHVPIGNNFLREKGNNFPWEERDQIALRKKKS